MATERQIRANRINALASTGPRTIAGKSNSKLNAISHGLTAASIVILGEDPVAFDRLREELILEYEPRGPTEEQLVEQFASLLWRARRIPVFEAALLTWSNHQLALTLDVEDMPNQAVRRMFGEDPRTLPAEVAPGAANTNEQQLRLGRLIESISMTDQLSKIMRYDATLMRQLKATLSMLLQLIEQRQKIEALNAVDARDAGGQG